MKKFNLKISDGKLSFSSDYHKALFSQFLKDNNGKILEVQLYQPIRSTQQNKYYWNFLTIIETETGNNAEDLHQFFKRKLLPPKWIKVLDQEIRIPKSTTELTKIEMGEYLDKISAMTGVELPDSELWLESQGYISNKKRYH